MDKRLVVSSVLLAALGYFVDIYDLILFSIVRVKSLMGLGVAQTELLSVGMLLLNMQMMGMLLGGIFWGILADKRGRLSVLLGSILLYSISNIANGFVHSVGAYAVLRFVAGVGLAGELGAGITLVSEVMSKETRIFGTTIVAVVGILGAIAAALVGELFDWRVAFWIGGAMGLGLLLLRIKASESGLFCQAQNANVKKGSLAVIFSSWKSVRKYFECILIGVPIWFVVGILITFSPEFGVALGIKVPPSAGQAVMFTYIGLALGGLLSGILSQYLASRKKAVAIFLMLDAFLIGVYLLYPCPPLGLFYFLCFALGVANGYWAIFVTIAAEQFGTNIRATVATTVPNFVRGAVVPLTLGFQALKPFVGILASGGIIAAICLVFAGISLKALEETHGKDLDYLS